MDVRVLVANRGEVAIRVLRAAATLGWSTVAVASEDDGDSLHTLRADRLVTLAGPGWRPYLDVGQLLDAAVSTGCSVLHPGWGFLSESATFAERCAEAGLVFVGPSPDVLRILGDKVAARRLAVELGLPVAAATVGAASLEQAAEFRAARGADRGVIIKAVSGGGGRAIREVGAGDDLAEAYARCRSEAVAAFGEGDLFVEELIGPARHVEVQIVGDGSGTVTVVGDRDCSVQRRHQKLIEVAPAPGLSTAMRSDLAAAATRLGEAVRYSGLGTFEFLVSDGPRLSGGPLMSGGTGPGEPDRASMVFMEANPRLQVEHTVTEAVTGVDLVAAQLLLATGATLAQVGLRPDDVGAPRGYAVEVRVNAEVQSADGEVHPAPGRLSAFEPPGGAGVRTDTHGYRGYRPHPGFDSLLAKVIVHTPAGDLFDATRLAARALDEFHIEGVATNRDLLGNILRRPELVDGGVDVGFVDRNLAGLLAPDPAPDPERRRSWFPDPAEADPPEADPPAPDPPSPENRDGAEGAEGAGGEVIRSPLAGMVVEVLVAPGDEVVDSTPVVVVEAMKMEHLVPAGVAGTVGLVTVGPAIAVVEGDPLLLIVPFSLAGAVAPAIGSDQVDVDLDTMRPDLSEVLERKAGLGDAARPAAVERRRRVGHRSARENVADLVDDGSFVEYGGLAVAAQRSRRSMDDLIANTPGDGVVGGTAHVNGHLFDDRQSRCAVMTYDYTVLAGTQGYQGHRKKDRLFALAARMRLPVVLFAEGGGGRPGDTDVPGVSGLDCMAFALFAALSGLVPLIGVVSGRCFAGNAALLGCCDVIIATEDASIGMAGPAMIEGGGLGTYRADEVGPISVQAPNGVVDVVVADEGEAVEAAKRYLAYFQGPVAPGPQADQRRLRSLIPENRLRVYDVRRIIEVLADVDTVLELRRAFAAGMVTALIRVEGRPLGVVANNPSHLGGAIDSDGADKAARFLQLCDAHDVPVLFLCDTPGFMVGPEAERTAQVRHFARLFVIEASLTIPYFCVVLRKAYGLGAQAMAGGSLHQPVFTVSWPTGEFGGMGLEGAVQLGFRRELDAVGDPGERRARFDELVARSYLRGRALNVATHFEIDDVIDPATTRDRVVRALRVAPAPEARSGKKRPCVDAW